MLRQSSTTTDVIAPRQGLHDITRDIAGWVASQDIGSGLLTIFCRHTSASLLIQENADPDVQTDLDGFFQRLVPEGMDWLVHTTEGPDDMPAHIKASLLATSLSIPILNGRLALGTWQGVYVVEHRATPHRRTVALNFIGHIAEG